MGSAVRLLVAAAGLSGCATGGPEPAVPAAASLDSVSVEMNSWGKPVADWTLERSGRGRYSFSRGVTGGGFWEYDLVTKSFPVSPADFKRVADLLAAARIHVGGEIPCRRQLTDGVYGRIAWTVAGEARAVPFDFGCLSTEANAIYGRLLDAHERVKALADKGETVKVEEIREPGG